MWKKFSLGACTGTKLYAFPSLLPQFSWMNENIYIYIYTCMYVNNIAISCREVHEGEIWKMSRGKCNKNYDFSEFSFFSVFGEKEREREGGVESSTSILFCKV